MSPDAHPDAYAKLDDYVGQINDLLTSISLLTWDARTQMPKGGAETRSKQLATLALLARERLASDTLRELLEDAEALEDADLYQRRGLQQLRDAVTFYSAMPATLVRELAEHRTLAQERWQEARAANDFAHFAPALEKMLALNRDLAAVLGDTLLGGDYHPYDALVQQYEPGMSVGTLRALFSTLRDTTLPLLDAIRARPAPDLLRGDFPVAQQRAFALDIAERFGYDLARGRLDVSAHPFEISFTRQDVRITTRYDRDYLPTALFGILHEAGHALYEQNVDPALTRSVLTSDLIGLYAVGGTSYGTHESQSRLWENMVGRSRPFWQQHIAPLQQAFPGACKDADAERVYRAVNRVAPSYIRVEADELTYNLHIMLRVELEIALVAGSLDVADLPDAWNAALERDLGLEPPPPARGVLQDIHWSAGLIGSFPTYTIGNVMAAQFFAAARQQVGGLDDALAAGDYRPLKDWLAEHIYRHGRAFSPRELLERTTGGGLEPAPYLDYLRTKYTDLYDL